MITRARAVLYNEAEQILVFDAAWISLGQGMTYYNVRESVFGFNMTGLGCPTLDQAYAMRLVEE